MKHIICRYPKKVEEVIRPNNLPATKKYAVRLNFDINEQVKAWSNFENRDLLLVFLL